MVDRGTQRSLFLADPPGAPDEPAEPPAGQPAPLVEVEGGKRRWLQVLVVLAVLAGGIVANRSAPPSVRVGPVERTSDGPVLGPARLPQSLATVARLGPLLPEPTGTTLLLGAGTQVLVLDVDSGTLRSVQLADLRVGSGHPWGSQAVTAGDAFIVRSRPPAAKVIPRTDGQPVADLVAGSGGGLYPSTTPDTFWVEEVRGEARLEEVDRSAVVRRSVPVPNGSESIVWDGTGFLQTVDGRIQSPGTEGEQPAPLGEGLVVAADAATAAVLGCGGEAVRGCDLSLVDRPSGTRRVVPLPDELTGFTAGRLDQPAPELSPDGRWLLLGATSARTSPTVRGDVAGPGAGVAVVDVAGGTVRAFEPGTSEGPPVAAFSPDGRWLFLGRSVGTVSAELDAVRLADGDRFDLDVEISARASFGLVLEAFPSVPADLGTGGG